MAQNQTIPDAQAPRPWWKNWKRLGLLGLAAFAAYVVYLFNAPQYGSIYYGICKTFVELNTPYPKTLKFFEIDPGQRNLRFMYSSTDPFGQTSLDSINCVFKQDEAGNLLYELESVDINRSRQYPEESPDVVNLFNKTIPTILANPPDLTLPPAIPSELRDMKN